MAIKQEKRRRRIQREFAENFGHVELVPSQFRRDSDLAKSPFGADFAKKSHH